MRHAIGSFRLGGNFCIGGNPHRRRRIMSGWDDRSQAPRLSAVFATVNDHNALLAATRRRVDELELPHQIVEDLAGLQSGYLSKVLADPPPKRMGAFTSFLILQALGLDMQLVENPQAMERLRPRFEKRKLRRKIRPAGRIVELTPDFYKRISRMGNEARRKLPPEKLSEIGRTAVNARWRRHRDLQVQTTLTVRK